MPEYIINKLKEDCELSESEINSLTKKEVLDNILEYEGIMGYTGWIISLVEDIFNISLEN